MTEWISVSERKPEVGEKGYVNPELNVEIEVVSVPWDDIQNLYWKYENKIDRFTLHRKILDDDIWKPIKKD